jgi:POT family proton-dependent oligopeptide transporter
MASPIDTPNSVDVHSDRSFFGHPRGLATLFFTEMWERFSYYGMRAILILFMTSSIAKGGLGFQDSKAGAVYGLYTAMVYLMCLGGGWIADLFTGQRRAVLYGGILIAAGEFALFVPSEPSFYLGLVLLMFGTGMLKGNVSTIVGQLYRKGDSRRDSGFSIFYMGINLGALIAPLICGYVGERISWRYGFAIAGLGMLIGVVQYIATSRHLGDAGLRPGTSGDPVEDRKQKRTALTAMGVGLAAIALVAGLAATGIIVLSADAISDGVGWCLLGISALVFAWLIFFGNWSAEERKRSAAILVLFISSAVFWAAYEQAGSSLTLFAERNTNRIVFGFLFPASWYQFVQPLFVITLAPVFAWLWLAMRHREPSSPAKFTWGLLFG